MTIQDALPLVFLIYWSLLGLVVGSRLRQDRRDPSVMLKMGFTAFGWYVSVFASEAIIKNGLGLGIFALLIAAHVLIAVAVIAWPFRAGKS